MRVRTNVAMLGFPSCSTLELDDADAASLISTGLAEPSTDPAENTGTLTLAPMTKPAPDPEPVVETADAPAAAETADAPPAPRKTPARKRKPATS